MAARLPALLPCVAMLTDPTKTTLIQDWSYINIVVLRDQRHDSMDFDIVKTVSLKFAVAL